MVARDLPDAPRARLQRAVNLTGASASHVLDALRTGALDDVTSLSLVNCGLRELPEDIGRLTRLEMLNCGGNNLKALPRALGRCRRLRIAFFLGNAFADAPEVLGELPELYMLSFKSNALREISETALPRSLGWLILSDNAIERLPSAIGECKAMRKLMLAGNRLRGLPESMKKLENLELLRIADNEFEEIPSWLYSLPKLTWLAAAGNPATDGSARKAEASVGEDELPLTPWEEFDVPMNAQPIGRGTSGNVYAGRLNGQLVALKVYANTEKTSDGRPQDELMASIVTSKVLSEGTVKTLGCFTRGNSRGLVMEYLNNDWQPLGKPPNFHTVTRDVYHDDTRFTAREIAAIAIDVGSALCELQSMGVCHGDIYAHNILFIRQAPGVKPRAKLGDFGATWFYDVDSPEASIIDACERRAYGTLLEEISSRHDGVANHSFVAACGSVLDDFLEKRPSSLRSVVDVLRRVAVIENIHDFSIPGLIGVSTATNLAT